ncbi:MAG: 30S ribosomal protein S12 methylthiotransferase RimO [Bacteroidales bacterium]|nr:30S ribosomal protein S12 methylthiotransferase RimO [Bacteroidales bacterium]
MSRYKVNVVTMGCSKNLVDSERVSRMLGDAGFDVSNDADMSPGERYTVVINTCGFIGDAKEESIEAILEACRAKEDGGVDRVYVMGCLSERYRDDLPAEIPEVDRWFGKFDWAGVADALVADTASSYARRRSREWDRKITTPSHHAYLKIAEGCNRFCAFCAIPLITGRFKSRPIEEILDEVAELVSRGVVEFNVIAQDLSAYGHDIYGRSALAELIERMAQTRGVGRIRLHYAYPADFPYDILPVMAAHDNVCKYLDIALQHIDDTVLGNMRRHITADETRRLLDRIRAEVPGIHIRTTLMVGFPGETDEAFERLIDFVKEQRFERMGAFAYCEEDDTWAARNLTDNISDDVKQQRLDRLMAVQEDIALETNEAKVGKTLRVLIDVEQDDYYVGRTEFDSPEVDPEVLVEKTVNLKPGQFCDVEILRALPFELIGRPV